MTKTKPPFPAEVRDRAVRMVLDHQGEPAMRWATICSIAAKIGCSGETLRKWVHQAECDRGSRARPTSSEGGRVKAWAREVRELRRTIENLRKASAYSGMAELDRPLKR